MIVGQSRTDADRTESSGTVAIAQLVIAAGLGLVAVPSILGVAVGPVAAAPDLSRPEPLIWLGVSLVLTVWLLLIAPSLTRLISKALASVSWVPAVDEEQAGPRFNSRVFAATLVAVGYVGLVEAILRRPFVAVVGAFAIPSDLDALVAALALAALLALLLRLYLAGRPLIESGARHALDAVATTSSSETSTRFSELVETATVAARVLAPMRQSTVAEATVAATSPASDDPTVVTSRSGDATVIAPSADPNATSFAPDSPTLPRST